MADITVEALNEAKRSNVETANRAERAIQTSRAFADAATSQAETSKKSATAAESSAITAKEVLQFEQSKGKAQLEVKVRRTFSKTVTIAARASVSISETLIGADGKIKEHVPFHGDDSDNKVPPLNGASQDVLTEIILLFRNLSYRPTAVIDVYVEREGIIGGRGYKGRIKPLPFQLEPWGIKEISFKIDKEDEKNDTKIMIIDIDDNKLEEDFVNLGARWTRMTEKRITMPIDGIIVEPERH